MSKPEPFTGMTDKDIAGAFLAFRPELGGMQVSDMRALCIDLANLFGRVRVTERAAIVAYVRRIRDTAPPMWAPGDYRRDVASSALSGVALLIEQGADTP